jgi:phospholipid/cholesterol/gamma-HCH transport system substrate-binding protein
VKLSKEVKVGIVTTLAIGCFIYGFNFLKGKNIFSTQRKFYAVYKDIDGLVQSNPLFVNGFRIGMVGPIELADDTTGNVIVTILVDDDLDIPRNTIAKVVSPGLLDSKAIQLVLGKSTDLAQPGDTLQSAKQAGLQENVSKQIAPLQRKVESLVASIDSVMVVVQQVFNEDARKNLSKSFESIKLAISSLETTSYRLDTLVVTEKVKISSILTKINQLATMLGNNSDKLNNVINNFSSISDSLAKSRLQSAINNADEALAQLAGIMTKVNKGEGTLGALVNNDSLYRKLDKTIEDLDKVLRDFKHNPNHYLAPLGKKGRGKPPAN